MAKYEGQDHYLDPETGVLKNKLGISEEEELKAADASLVAWRTYQLVEKPLQGRFDLDHLKAIHQPNGNLSITWLTTMATSSTGRTSAKTI
jgi:cell filamentation protein